MKHFVQLLLIVSLMLSFAGCKTGIQVQDNYYDALGGQVLKVDKDFIYLGHCDPAVLTTSEFGRPKADSGVKTRGDVFIKVMDGKAEEFVILQRLMLTKTGWGWNPGPGVPMKFHGTRYKEAYVSSAESSDTTVASYIQFVENNGYSVEAKHFSVRLLTRNVGAQSRVSVLYGVIPEIFPSTIYGNEKKELDYLRERFEDVVSVPQ